MKKAKFDKNKNYSSTEIADALWTEIGIFYADVKSLRGCINDYIRKTKISAVNNQKNHRVFSGNDCQSIYDYFLSYRKCKKLTGPVKESNYPTLVKAQETEDGPEYIDIGIKPLWVICPSDELRKNIEMRSEIYGISIEEVILNLLRVAIKNDPLDVAATKINMMTEAELRELALKNKDLLFGGEL